MLVITIGGASGSGKTHLAQKLKEKLQNAEYQVESLALDNYYYPLVPGEDSSTKNFDHPAAFNSKLLIQNLHSLDKGEWIAAPKYSFITGQISETIPINGENLQIIIVEGIFALSLLEKISLPQLRIYIEASSYTTILQRRYQRDQGPERQTSVAESQRRELFQNVRTGFWKYVAPSKILAEIKLSCDYHPTQPDTHQKAAESLRQDLDLIKQKVDKEMHVLPQRKIA